jgi:hypothetical protein
MVQIRTSAGTSALFGVVVARVKIMSRTLELPDVLYDALIEAAQADGVTPVDWIAEHLPLPPPRPTPAERQAAHARLRQHIVALGHATGIDNESIDADLARAYGDDHATRDAKDAAS